MKKKIKKENEKKQEGEYDERNANKDGDEEKVREVKNSLSRRIEIVRTGLQKIDTFKRYIFTLVLMKLKMTKSE